MMGCPSRRMLEQYLDDQVHGAERALLESHVGECRICQQRLEDMASADDADKLRNLHTRHSASIAEPKGDLFRRIEQAALSGSRLSSSDEVVIEATGAYRSPEAPLPAAPYAASLSDQPTRNAFPDGGDGPNAGIGLQPGTILGQYRLLEQVGAGGMGQVYKAVHIAMDRVVALKVISPYLVRDARVRARFQQEVRTAARLHHPNIVMAHDAAEANGLSFLVMEHVEGTTLSSLVAEQGLPPVPLACEIIRQAALGLQHAHDKGMVHRDIKPGNLMVAAQHTPGSGAVVPRPKRGESLPGWPSAPLTKILDFGVARLREFGPDGEPMKMKTLTQEGCVVGTPEFMSPEQACDSRTVDIRSDIYSLGCTFYFLLTGRPPFSANTALETMVQHLKRPLPRVDELRPGLAPGLTEIVHKMLAKAADERYQTPAELAEALLPWCGDFTSSVSPEVIAVQRGLAPTEPSSFQGLQRTSDYRPAADMPPKRADASAPAAHGWSKAGTFFALFLLFLVSAMAFWVISTLFDSPASREGEDPEDGRPNSVGMTFIRLPEGELRRQIDGKNQRVIFHHKVDVSATEVTYGQFSRFVREAEHRTLAERGRKRGALKAGPGSGEWDAKLNWKQAGVSDEDVPVTCVAWEDAVEFCNWLSKRESKKPCYVHREADWICEFYHNGYRLPTDAEWEYAARAGEKTLLPAAETELLAFGWFRPNSNGQPHAARQLRHNLQDIYDMWGNVWEWCWDWDGPPRAEAKLEDPNGPLEGKERVIWGGGWNDSPANLAQTPRKAMPPDFRATDVGFRVVRSVLDR
jgi:serine/threonine-protein kinase